MYMIESFIDMGLKKRQKFPSDVYRRVAINLAIGNPLITTRDSLIDVVQSVLSIPKDKIKTVTLNDLSKYGLSTFVK